MSKTFAHFVSNKSDYVLPNATPTSLGGVTLVANAINPIVYNQDQIDNKYFIQNNSTNEIIFNGSATHNNSCYFKGKCDFLTGNIYKVDNNSNIKFHTFENPIIISQSKSLRPLDDKRFSGVIYQNNGLDDTIDNSTYYTMGFVDNILSYKLTLRNNNGVADTFSINDNSNPWIPVNGVGTSITNKITFFRTGKLKSDSPFSTLSIPWDKEFLQKNIKKGKMYKITVDESLNRGEFYKNENNIQSSLTNSTTFTKCKSGSENKSIYQKLFIDNVSVGENDIDSQLPIIFQASIFHLLSFNTIKFAGQFNEITSPFTSIIFGSMIDPITKKYNNLPFEPTSFYTMQGLMPNGSVNLENNFFIRKKTEFICEIPDYADDYSLYHKLLNGYGLYDGSYFPYGGWLNNHLDTTATITIEEHETK